MDQVEYCYVKEGSGCLSSNTRTRWKHIIFWIGAITAPCIASFAAYAAVLSYDNYIWDDAANFVFRPDLRRLTLDNMAKWFDPSEGVGRILGRYEPVAQVFKAVLATRGLISLDESKAQAMHAFLLCSHAVCSALSVAVAAKIGIHEFPATASVVRCGLGGVLFACHPLRAQVVGWVSCAPIVWATIFCQLALCCTRWPNKHFESNANAVRATTDQHPNVKCAAALMLRRAVAVLLYVAACLTKASALPLPFCILLIKWDMEMSANRALPRAPRLRMAAQIMVSNVSQTFEFWLLMPLLAWVTLGKFDRGSTIAIAPQDLAPRASIGLWSHVVQTMFPLYLSPVHPMPNTGDFAPRTRICGYLALSQIAIVTSWVFHFLLRRSDSSVRMIYHRLAIIWLCMLALMLPFALPSGQPTLFADRNTYLTSAIIFPVIVNTSLGQVIKKLMPLFGRGVHIVIAFGIFVLVASWCLFASPAAVELYRSETALWQRVVDLYPNDHAALHNLGAALRKQKHLDNAEVLLRKSLCLHETPLAAFTLHEILREARVTEARKWVAKALRMMYVHKHPVSSFFQVAMIHNDMGVHAAIEGDMKLALDNFQEALRWSAAHIGDGRIRANLGLAYALSNEGGKCSATLLRTPLQFSGTWRARLYNLLGVCYFLKGDIPLAKDAAQSAVTTARDIGTVYSAYLENLNLFKKIQGFRKQPRDAGEVQDLQPKIEKEWLWAT